MIKHRDTASIEICRRCRNLTSGKDLQAFDDKPRTYYCPSCIEYFQNALQRT